MLKRNLKDIEFEISRKVIAKVYEEVRIIIKSKPEGLLRFILSHRPIKPEMVVLYVNGIPVVYGEDAQFQVEDQSVFVSPSLVRKGMNFILAKYEYLQMM